MKKLLLLCTLLCSLVSAQGAVTTRIVKDSLFIPWEILWGSDDNIWLTQKNGYICRLHPATGVLDTLYREAATVIQSEGGMLGMALHPQFTSNPYVYVVYDYMQGSAYRERVVRYTYNGSNALGSPIVLLDNVNAAVNHNGSRLLIVGDKLFITTGDATVSSSAQNLSSPNGKVHRINLDGTIPSDNPIAGSTIWSWGHRNAQGLVFANGMLYSSEHGANSDDEVNIIRKGRNYGWPTVEGFCDKPAELQFCADSNVVQPLAVWTPTIAPAGIDYYGGDMFPQWKGALLMASLKDQHLYVLGLNAGKDSIVSKNTVSEVAFGRLRDVCVAPNGRVYVSTSNSVASGTGAKVDRIVEVYDPAFVPSGVSGFNAGLLPLSVHPNPVGDVLSGTYDKGDADYIIRSLSDSRVISVGKMQGGAFAIPVDMLPCGGYLLQVQATADGRTGIVSFIRK